MDKDEVDNGYGVGAIGGRGDGDAPHHIKEAFVLMISVIPFLVAAGQVNMRSPRVGEDVQVRHHLRKTKNNSAFSFKQEDDHHKWTS